MLSGGAAKKLLGSVRRLLPRTDYVRFAGSVLPPRDMRSCGVEFRDDAFYLSSAESLAKSVRDRFGCRPETRILDVGCGQGRLATGIIRILGAMNYIGIDVHRDSIQWCKRHIEARYPIFKFHLLPVRNERYNPRGVALTPGFRFDLPSGGFDLICLYAVFTNMSEVDMCIYLTALRHLLAHTGRVFFTAYAEDGVPPVTVNPEGYIAKRCSGPLHVVRYARSYLLSLVAQLGYAVERFDHAVEVNGQSAVCLSKSPASA
jgi:SAM-dependent methyltransferase